MVLHNCTCRMVCAMWDGEWDVRRLDESRLHQLLPDGPGPRRRPRGAGRGGRPPDGREGTPRPSMGVSTRGELAGLGPDAPGLRPRGRAPLRRSGGRGRGGRLPRRGRGRAAAQVAQRPGGGRCEAGRRPGRDPVRGRAALGRRGRDRAQRELAGSRGRRRYVPRGPGSRRGSARPLSAARAHARGNSRRAGPGSTTTRGGASWPTRSGGAAGRSGARCRWSCPPRRSRAGPSRSTRPDGWWSRPPRDPARLSVGDVVYLRR